MSENESRKNLNEVRGHEVVGAQVVNDSVNEDAGVVEDAIGDEIEGVTEDAIEGAIEDVIADVESAEGANGMDGSHKHGAAGEHGEAPDAGDGVEVGVEGDVDSYSHSSD